MENYNILVIFRQVSEFIRRFYFNSDLGMIINDLYILCAGLYIQPNLLLQ